MELLTMTDDEIFRALADASHRCDELLRDAKTDDYWRHFTHTYQPLMHERNRRAEMRQKEIAR